MFYLRLVVWAVCVLVVGCSRAPVAAEDGAAIRIVSLAPSLTEAICAVGAGELLVGRTSACNYPPTIVDSVPVIGGFGVPSLELLAKARPTLVLETALADESIGAQLDSMGIRRQRIACRSLEDLPAMLREIGMLTGHTEEGEVLAAALGIEIEKRRAVSVPESAPRVYAEIWHDPMTTIGKGTFLSDLIALAGGCSVGDSASKDYYQISPEHVISSDPDVILCLYMGKNEGASDKLKSRPGWQHVKAVQRDAVYDGLENDILLRPGPRVLEGIEQLRECIWGRDEG